MTPNQVYTTKSLGIAYQLLAIFTCRLYGQESMETFLQSWVVMLDRLTNEGIPFHWSDMLALQLKIHVSNVYNLHKDEKARFFMSAYLLDEICAEQQFPGMGWTWIPSEDVVNVYYKSLSKCIY